MTTRLEAFSKQSKPAKPEPIHIDPAQLAAFENFGKPAKPEPIQIDPAQLAAFGQSGKPAKPEPIRIDPAQLAAFERSGKPVLLPPPGYPAGTLRNLTEPEPSTTKVNPVPEQYQWLAEQHPDLVRSWQHGEPIDWKEQLSKTAWAEKMPFSPIGAIKTGRLLMAAKRLQKPEEYEKTPYVIESRGFVGGGIMPPRGGAFTKRKRSKKETQELKEADEELIGAFMLAQAEEDIRGTTFGAKFTEGVTELPAYMIEFMATGGGATVVRKAIGKVAKKVGRKYAEKGAAKIAVKSLGWLGGGLGRTFLMPHRTAEATMERLLPTDMQLTDKGDLIVKTAGERPWTALYKGVGDILIENMSEVAGPAIGKVGGKLTGKIGIQLKKAFKVLHPSEKVNKIFAKAGFHGFLEELGEERLGALMRYAAGVNTLEELKQQHSFENLLVEAAVLAVPGGIRAGAGVAAKAAEMAIYKKGGEIGDKGIRGFVEVEEEPGAVGPISLYPTFDRFRRAEPDKDGWRTVKADNYEQGNQIVEEFRTRSDKYGL